MVLARRNIQPRNTCYVNSADARHGTAISLSGCGFEAVIVRLKLRPPRACETSFASTIFCTQYEPDGWYLRIGSEENRASPITDSIMDRIKNNAYVVPLCVESMRKRHGVAAEGGALG